VVWTTDTRKCSGYKNGRPRHSKQRLSRNSTSPHSFNLKKPTPHISRSTFYYHSTINHRNEALRRTCCPCRSGGCCPVRSLPRSLRSLGSFRTLHHREHMLQERRLLRWERLHLLRCQRYWVLLRYEGRLVRRAWEEGQHRIWKAGITAGAERVWRSFEAILCI
jgi:hypothetical protein